MKKLNTVLFALVLLGGCAADIDGSTSALGDETGGVCEPHHAQPIVDWDTNTIHMADVDMTFLDGAIDLHITAVAPYSLDNYYIYLGPDPSHLVGYFPHPTDDPQLEYHLTVPYEDLGLACGDDVKVIIQGWMRTEAGDVYAVAYGDVGGPGDGFFSYYELCCTPDEPSGCTLTQGYWKNHRDAWPVDSLTLGDETYDADALMGLLNTPVRGDASLNLAHQLIAAELNAASGATAPAEIADAQAWLSANGGTLPYGIRSRTAAGSEAVALAGALASYNEGATGPGHCDD